MNGSKVMKYFYKIFILVLAGLHLLRTLVNFDLSYPIFISAVIVILSGVSMMGKGFKKATLTFLTIGVLMLIGFAQPLKIWVSSFNSMTNVIAVLVIMQTFSIPIEVGKYNQAIRYWLNRSFKGQGGLFLFTTLATHVFTSFLMFGAIPVMFSLMEETLKGRVSQYQRFMATATSRGYALASLWAPGAINLFLVVQATGLNWTKLFLPGVILGMIGILISYFIEKRLSFSSGEREVDESYKEVRLEEKQNGNKVWHIIFVVVSLSGLTLLFDRLNLGASSSTVILAGAVVALVWIIQLRKLSGMSQALENYWNNGILKAADIAPFFISIGMFSAALEHSGIIIQMQGNLQNYANQLGFYAFILIPLFMIFFSVLGLHPFVSIVMFGKILTSMHLSISPVTLALCLALGGSISYMLSPFAGVIMAISKFLNAKAEDVALRWNWIFSVSYFIVGIVFAYFWGNLFP
jgi:hypothetical protein